MKQDIIHAFDVMPAEPIQALVRQTISFVEDRYHFEANEANHLIH
jgi:hypothetical protein